MTTERQLFNFLCKHYVQRADNRQRSMGLQYTEAETHDLARTLDNWLRNEGGWTPPLPELPDAQPRRAAAAWSAVMTPQELRQLADRIDHEQLWRWAGKDRDKMTTEQRDRHAAGVAIRRWARHLRGMAEAYDAGKSVLITPMSVTGLSRAQMTVDIPAEHRRLL